MTKARRRIALLAIVVAGAFVLASALVGASPPGDVTRDAGSSLDVSAAPGPTEAAAVDRMGASAATAETPNRSTAVRSTPTATETAAAASEYDENSTEIDVLVPERNPRSDETVTIYVAVHDNSSAIFQPVAGAEVEVRITPDEWDVDPDGHVKRVNVTTNENGYAAVQYDFEGNPNATYEFEASTGAIDDDSDGVTDMKLRSAGPEAYVPTTTANAIVGAETNDFTAYHDGRLPVQDYEERVVVTNEADEELANESVVADAAGVVSVPFVPEDTGYFGAASGVNYSVGLAPAVDMQLADDRTAVAGRVLGPDGPAANATITLQLKEGYQSTLEERNVTTDDGGWFETEFGAVPSSAAYRFEAQTLDGDPVYVRPEWAALTHDPSLDRGAPLFGYPDGGYGEGGYALDGYGSPNQYQRPYSTDADPTDVQLDVQFAESDGSWAPPGGQPTVQVEGTYGDGSPAAGETVEAGVYLHRGIRSAVVTNATVTLGDDGTATLDAAIPEDAPEGTYALAAGAHVDGDNATLDTSGALKIQRYVTDIEGLDGPVTPGETASFDVVTRGPDGDPVEGAPITVVGMTHLNERYVDGDFARTDADGRATLEVDVPEDVRQRFAVRFMGEYTSPVFSSAVRLPVENDRLDSSLDAQQVAPDESIEFSYDTGTDRGPALVTVETETGFTSFHTVTQGDVAIPLPEGAEAGQEYHVSVRARDADGQVQTSEGTVEVVDQPVRVDFEYSPDEPEVGQPIEFDASPSVATSGEITGYEWSFGGNATANGTVVEHTFEAAGTHPVTLTATNETNATFDLTRDVTVREADDGNESDDGENESSDGEEESDGGDDAGDDAGSGGYPPPPPPDDGDTEEASPNFTVEIASVPEDVEPGDDGTMVFGITNGGDGAGTFTGTVLIDGETNERLTAEIEPGETAERSVEYAFEDEGVSIVVLGNASARIPVEAPPDTNETDPDGTDSNGTDPTNGTGTDGNGTDADGNGTDVDGNGTDGGEAGNGTTGDGTPSADESTSTDDGIGGDRLAGTGGLALSALLGGLSLRRRGVLP